MERGVHLDTPVRPSRSLRFLAVLVALVGAGALLQASLTESLVGRQVFPVTNWWNQDVTTAPVDSHSAAYINYISGRTSGSTPVRRLHPDFGPPPYGFPYVVVAGTQARVPVTFVEYGGESDSGIGGVTGYPVPPEAKTTANYIEGGEHRRRHGRRSPHAHRGS